MKYIDAVDTLNKTREQREAINKTINELKENLANTNSLSEAQGFDAKITENKNQIKNLDAEIENLTSIIENKGGKDDMANKYLESTKAAEDFGSLVLNSNSKSEFETKWKQRLTENGVNISGDDAQLLLPKTVDLGIQSTIKANPVYDLFTIVSGGNLVYKKFTTTDKAQTRGSQYNITAPKVEQASTLAVRNLVRNQIYKMTSIDYAALKDLGDNFVTFLIQECAQYVIDRIVELSLYDGEGTNDANHNEGFDAIVSSDAAVKVQFKDSLADAIRNNAFRANGVSSVTITASGTADASSTTLIVNNADYAAILSEATKLNYNVSDVPGWLGVGQVVVKDSTSKNYAPIILKKGAYIVGTDDFDKFDFYSILTNQSQHEVVTRANGTLFEPGAAVVFTSANSSNNSAGNTTTGVPYPNK